jgi:hypothetical protein
MQATLFIAAMSPSVIRGGLFVSDKVTFYYKSQTIALLNQRLSESSGPVSDATLMAVGCLISLEVCSTTLLSGPSSQCPEFKCDTCCSENASHGT